MSQIIKVALIGAGNMAEQHAKVYAALDDVELVGIHSRTRSKAENLANRHGISAVYDSIEELWHSTKADLVLVTVRELQLLAVVEQVSAFDWAIFLEKPAGYNLDVAIKVRDTIENAGRQAFVGFNRRFYDSVLQAQKILREDGPTRHIVVNDQQSFAEARAVGHPEEVVQNFMYANSIHLIDYVRNFGRGKIMSVDVQQKWKQEDSFIVSAFIQFESGDTARYEAIWNAPGPWSCSITTSEVRLEMRPLESLTMQSKGTRRVDAMDIDAVDSEFKAGFYRQAEHTVHAIKGDDSLIPTIDESFEVMKLINQIYGQ